MLIRLLFLPRAPLLFVVAGLCPGGRRCHAACAGAPAEPWQQVSVSHWLSVVLQVLEAVGYHELSMLLNGLLYTRNSRMLGVRVGTPPKQQNLLARAAEEGEHHEAHQLWTHVFNMVHNRCWNGHISGAWCRASPIECRHGACLQVSREIFDASMSSC